MATASPDPMINFHTEPSELIIYHSFMSKKWYVFQEHSISNVTHETTIKVAVTSVSHKTRKKNYVVSEIYIISLSFCYYFLNYLNLNFILLNFIVNVMPLRNNFIFEKSVYFPVTPDILHGLLRSWHLSFYCLIGNNFLSL